MLKQIQKSARKKIKKIFKCINRRVNLYRQEATYLQLGMEKMILCYTWIKMLFQYIQKHIKLIFTIYVLGSLYSTPVIYAASVSNAVDATKENTNIVSNLFSADFFINIIFAVIVFIGCIVLSKVISTRLSSVIERRSWDNGASASEVAWMISRTLSITFLFIGFSLALSILWVDLWIFMWGIWFGLWFTLKTFLTNFVWGIMMITQGQYHYGDLVEVQWKVWTIVKVHSLFTEIKQFDGVIFYIPNVIFMEEAVSNFRTNSMRRVEIDVWVDYDTDIMRAKKVMLQVLNNFPNILTSPAANVFVDSFWDNAIKLSLRFWISSDDAFLEMKSNVTETVNLAFKQAGIVIAFPQVTISKRSV